MDLREAGVGEGGALLVGAPDRGGVAALGVGGEVEDVAVAAGGEDDGVGRVRLDLARDHVADDDAARAAVDHDQLQHLVARVHLRPCPGRSAAPGPGRRRAGAAGRSGRARRTCARPARRRRSGWPAVPPYSRAKGTPWATHWSMMFTLTCGQAVDVGLAGAEVAALDRVVEEAVDAVAVVLVVLGGVDAALGGDGVRAARAVLVAEALHVVAELGQRGGGGAAGQAGADHDHGVLPLVGGVDQLHLEAVLVPLLLDRARRGPSLELISGSSRLGGASRIRLLVHAPGEHRHREGDVAGTITTAVMQAAKAWRRRL